MQSVNTRQPPAGRALTELLYAKAGFLGVPLSGTFELSPVCNFNCRMCYVRKTQKEVQESTRGILTLEDWRRIARDARDAGMLYLLLTGGEPLLWPGFWTLYDELIDLGFLISINTNGSLIDDEAIAHFQKKPPRRINITLYGAGDETYRRLCGIGGVFFKVDRAIRGLQEAGITVKLNCSLTPENAADLDWIVDYARERELLLSVATYMFPPVRREPGMFGRNERFTPEEAAAYRMRFLQRQWEPEEYRRYLEQILDGCVEPPGLEEGCIDPVDGRIRCQAGKASFWITWDGWMMPCGMMPEPKEDLKQKGFGKAWQSLVAASGEMKLSGVCDKCANHGICHACAAIAYAETGSWGEIPTYLCRVAQQMRQIAQETLSVEQNSQFLPVGNNDRRRGK